MIISELFNKITVSPKVSFWISTLALLIVLFNNHVYLQRVIEREKEAGISLKRNVEEAEALRKRERVLREWEIQLILRETELKNLIKRISPGKASQ